MKHLERQIRAAQRRLWLNRMITHSSWSLTAAATAFAAVVMIQRLYDFPIPLVWIGACLATLSLLLSGIWTVATRENALVAASTLDQAAGLRERLSSGHHCQASNDPFARAVVADAERASESLTARKHIRLAVPRPMAFTAASIVLAALMFLITPGLLKREEEVQAARQADEAAQARVAVKRKLDAVRKMAQSSPHLEDLKEDIDKLNQEPGGMLRKPGDIRHEAVKKIDHLADAVRKKRDNPHYDGLKGMRKMMRGLKMPSPATAPTQKLARALSRGDFKTAKEEIKALRETLATLKSEQDKEAIAKLTRQLDELGKQIEKAARNDRLAENLKEVGLQKKKVDRLLQNLKKRDLEQLKKDLEERGMSQQQIKKILNQLQQNQRSAGMARKFAKALKQGAQAGSAGQSGDAAGGLSQAEAQLSELEALEVEMSQLDTMLADLQDARSDLDKPCSSCNGAGCGRCQGQGDGAGMGGLGRGQGGLAPEQRTQIGFKTERGKVHIGKGAIIGQFLVDGEQVAGDVTSGFAEVVNAAERDASDRINRDRVPRQYQKAVKAYFSTVGRLADPARTAEEAAAPGESPADRSDQSPTESDAD